MPLCMSMCVYRRAGKYAHRYALKSDAAHRCMHMHVQGSAGRSVQAFSCGEVPRVARPVVLAGFSVRMGAALDRPHVAQRIAPLQRFMVDHVHARRRGTAVADSSTSALEDDESATLGTDNSTFASCSYCSLPLGKRYLRLRHKCDFCDKVVCAACAPSMVQTQGAAEPQRACARCVSPIDQVRCAKDRLAKVEHRLRVLADDDPTSMGSSKDSGGAGGSAPRVSS